MRCRSLSTAVRLDRVLPPSRSSAGDDGLFGLPLNGPPSFATLAARSVSQSHALMEDIVAPRTGALEKLQKLDQCSQRICEVIDAAELTRMVHPDEALRAAADSAFSEISRVISQFNTDPRLYDATCAIATSAEYGALGVEGQRVVQSLRTEFESHGIHLDAHARQRVVDLQANIAALAYEFQNTGAGLAQLLRLRRELAGVLGKRSFAEVLMAGRLFESPEHVYGTLQRMLAQWSGIAKTAPPIPAAPLSVSFASCMAAIARASAVLGVQVTLAPRTLWAPDVWELHLRAAHDDALLGVVYLDPFARRAKQSAVSATFMVSFRVGNSVSPDALNRCALVTSLRDANHLSAGDVVLLFHEWGHVLNAVLSRTEYQHCAGTRGPIDTVEVPSLLFEHFAFHPGILDVDAGVLAQHRAHKRACLDMPTIINASLLDLRLHSGATPDAALVRSAASMRHLGPYAASYYTYAVCQQIADSIWDRAIVAGGDDGSARVVHELLARGGTGDMREIVRKLTKCSLDDVLFAGPPHARPD